MTTPRFGRIRNFKIPENPGALFLSPKKYENPSILTPPYRNINFGSGNKTASIFRAPKQLLIFNYSTTYVCYARQKHK